MMKIVFKTSLDSEKCKRKALKAVAGIEGCYSTAVDLKDQTITVVGQQDPVRLCKRLRKLGFRVELLSVGPSKDPAAQFNFAFPSHHTSLATSTSASTATSTSASTASASASGSYVYDVFISHRGPDTKKGFASHLYRALIRHSYRVFLDNEEMQRGENLMLQIEGAIQTASVYIAVLSPGYAASEWCLKELVLMLESRSQRRSTILPVFHGVRPSDLRWAGGQKGIYGPALSELEQKKRFDLHTIDNWKMALHEVANISGFELESCNCDEGLLVEKVVQRVLEIVSKTSLPKTSLRGAKFPTGLDDKVKDFESAMLLQQQIQETRVIGIAGLGGVGKTTLAKEIFNRRLSKYNKSCFLSNVRASPIGSLQSRLLKDLAHSNKQIDDQDDFSLDEDEIKILSSDPVLMVLDNVDNVNQLHALFEPVINILKSGSLILITSRDKDVLKKAEILESSSYMVTGLNQQHSLELFCSHAFGQRNPPIGFEQVVKDFLSLSNGLPLSLQVLGALLYKEELWYCEAQFRETSKVLPGDIQSCIKISYDGLNEQEKQIFLDIACFFIGEDKDTALRIWKGFHWEGRLGLHHLENRCLVEVDTENRIRMHDHVRDLGRDMAEIEPGEGRRLWNDPNNRQLSDQSLVRGISMLGGDGREWSRQSLENFASSSLATNMSSLQLLRARGDSVQNIFTDGCSPLLRWLCWYDCLYFCLPHWIPQQNPQLRWLCWYDCSYSCLPHWIPLQNLTVLQVKGGELRTLWPHESEAPLKFRELSIEGCPFEIPKSIGKLKDLQKFVLHSSVDIETLPDGFCDLRSLEHLELYNSKIKSLPHSFSKLTNLRCIRLSGCSELKMLPDSFGELANLQHINLSSCSELKMLPDYFGELANLQHIDLSGCSTLHTLPESFGSLRNLQHINLAWCYKLGTLPDSFGELANLQYINLSRCSNLHTLPESFGSLRNLQHINLAWCSKLGTLPDSFVELANLQHINLSVCSTLHTLSESFGSLRSLQHINLAGCSKLGTLPDSFGELANLQHINLSGCLTLHTLPESFGSLRNLQHINLAWCLKLGTLPDSFAKLKNLQHIDLESCTALRTLPDIFGNLTNLRHIDLSWCNVERPISLENLIQTKSQSD